MNQHAGTKGAHSENPDSRIRVRVRDPPDRAGPTGPLVGPIDDQDGPQESTVGPNGPTPQSPEEMDYIGTHSLPVDSLRIGQLFSSQSKYSPTNSFH